MTKESLKGLVYVLVTLSILSFLVSPVAAEVIRGENIQPSEMSLAEYVEKYSTYAGNYCPFLPAEDGLEDSDLQYDENYLVVTPGGGAFQELPAEIRDNLVPAEDSVPMISWSRNMVYQRYTVQKMELPSDDPDVEPLLFYSIAFSDGTTTRRKYSEGGMPEINFNTVAFANSCGLPIEVSEILSNNKYCFDNRNYFNAEGRGRQFITIVFPVKTVTKG